MPRSNIILENYWKVHKNCWKWPSIKGNLWRQMITLEYASAREGFLNVWLFFQLLFDIFDISDLLFSGFSATYFPVKISKDKIYKYCVPKWEFFYQNLGWNDYWFYHKKNLFCMKSFIYCLSGVWGTILCITLTKIFHAYVGS